MDTPPWDSIHPPENQNSFVISSATCPGNLSHPEEIQHVRFYFPIEVVHHNGTGTLSDLPSHLHHPPRPLSTLPLPFRLFLSAFQSSAFAYGYASFDFVRFSRFRYRSRRVQLLPRRFRPWNPASFSHSLPRRFTIDARSLSCSHKLFTTEQRAINPNQRGCSRVTSVALSGHRSTSSTSSNLRRTWGALPSRKSRASWTASRT